MGEFNKKMNEIFEKFMNISPLHLIGLFVAAGLILWGVTEVTQGLDRGHIYTDRKIIELVTADYTKKFKCSNVNVDVYNVSGLQIWNDGSLYVEAQVAVTAECRNGKYNNTRFEYYFEKDKWNNDVAYTHQWTW